MYSSNEMEWNNDMCIELIDSYRKETTLWDPKHPNHYSKAEKLKSWKVLASTFNTSVIAIKNKMCSLLGSFRREKSKERRSLLAAGNGKKVYRSKWFAYESMLFLQTRDDGKAELLDMGSIDIDDADMVCKDDVDEGEVSEETNFENQFLEAHQLSTTIKSELQDDEDTQHTSGESFTIPEPPKPKRQRTMKEDPLMEKKWLSPSVWLSDESSIYGQHVANKLRSYKPKTRALVEHAINNIIFEADMGRYDNVVFQSMNENPNIWNPTIIPDQSGESSCASNNSS